MKKLSPKTAELLADAKAGELLTKTQTEILVAVNQGYVFRYYPKGFDYDGPTDFKARQAWEEKSFQQSLTDTEPKWRMIGRSKHTLHKNEYLMLCMGPASGGGFEWDIMIDGTTVGGSGREDTAFKAAIAGGRAFEAELYAREFVEPDDFLAVKTPEEVSMHWTVEKLVLWAADKLKTTDAQAVYEHLKCEGLHHEDTPKEAHEAVTRYRHLNSDARMKRVRTILSRTKESPP